MSLLEMLNARIEDMLDGAGVEAKDDRFGSSKANDPDDFLIRQELKHWAGTRNVPGQAKLRLLQAAALQKNLPVEKWEKPRRKNPKHYPPEPWDQVCLPGYLALAFTYSHVRYIS